VITSAYRAPSARRLESERNMGIRRRASTTHGPHRRAAVLALAIVALLPAAAWAQSFPTKPIRLLLPFAAGGAADLFGRSLASGLSTELGQQVVVETRPGAG
jgi:hypothetical protein